MENTHDVFGWVCGYLSFASTTSGSLPVVTSGSLPSVQNYNPYIVFSSPTQKYEHPLRLTYWLGYRNLHTSGFFFPVTCLSYLRMEISVILYRGNTLYSSSSIFIFSFLWPTLLMLSCDHIELAKFILSTLSLAKLVYHNSRHQYIHSLKVYITNGRPAKCNGWQASLANPFLLSKVLIGFCILLGLCHT